MNSVYPNSTKTLVLKLRTQGLTYRKIAKKMGIPAPTIGYWIRVEGRKSTAKAKKLGTKFRKPKRTKS